MSEDKPEYVLKKVFQHQEFRPRQKEIIQSVLLERDCIALLPTGGGKSIIYTISSIILGAITIIVEPLKSLMEEQVKYLRSKNITSFFINSPLSQDRISEVISTLTNTYTRYALLFTSPEWLQSPQIKNMLNSLKAQERFKLIAIDEAHCVDLWGGSFRASYSNLAFLKEFQVPIIALSGSATDHTISVIHQSLKMDCPIVSRVSFLRTNLGISVMKKSCKHVKQIVDLIALKNPEQCGMVYCNKRKTTVHS